MSKIGNLHIEVPAQAKVNLQGSSVLLEGPKGKLQRELPATLSINFTDNLLHINRASDAPSVKALHGLWRSLVNNMVIGVTEGFQKKLELVGTGYRAQVKGGGLELSIGFSHLVQVLPLGGNQLSIDSPTVIVVSGTDKETVGHQAAVIRNLRKPNVYTGSGIRYQGEVIRRKAGKTGAGSK